MQLILVICLLQEPGLNSGSMSSRTRGIRVGGDPTTNEIRFVTIASTGDEQTFGTLDSSRRQMSSVSNGDKRCVWWRNTN